MPEFNGQLRNNLIFTALFNMIISQQVFGDNIAGTFSKLVDEARVDGTLYGDTKLYYSTDALHTTEWGNDDEAINLLKLHRPKAPQVQKIVLDKFRQISLTVDNYLTKQGFAEEGSFSTFTSIMLGWMRETKRIYDSTLYNVYIGTTTGATPAQTREIAISDAVGTTTGLEKARLEGLAIAEDIANLIIELQTPSRKFNDYGNIRSYSEDEIKIVFNSKYLNKLKYVDLPTIFHSEGLVKKMGEYVLPPEFFGTILTEGGTADGTQRSVGETTYGTVTVYPGELIPAGQAYEAGQAYVVDEDVVCKVLVKLPPYMSAFEAATSFYNAKSLTDNRYLTFGHNTIEYLKNYPFITVHAD